jgi:hypothetical protein
VVIDFELKFLLMVRFVSTKFVVFHLRFLNIWCISTEYEENLATCILKDSFSIEHCLIIGLNKKLRTTKPLCSLLEDKYIVHLNNNSLGHKVAVLRSILGTRQIASHVHHPRIAIKEVEFSQLQNSRASAKLISVLMSAVQAWETKRIK